MRAARNLSHLSRRNFAQLVVTRVGVGLQESTELSFRNASGPTNTLRPARASSGSIEPCLSNVERVAGNVKRRRAGGPLLRWSTTGLLETERKFRKVKDFRELELCGAN